MIIDLTDFEASEMPPYRICIVGAGPAGLVVAAELMRRGVLGICVLESGDYKPNPARNELRLLEAHGLPIKESSRERVLGGASITWGGLSAPLDPIDFAERPFVPYSGWPIPYSVLLPYYRLVGERYWFPRIEHYEESRQPRKATDKGMSIGWNDLAEKVFVATQEPVNFGSKLLNHFRNPKADLYLNATVLEFHCTNPQMVGACTMTAPGGKKYTVNAKTYVLASGTIENARLLLSSKSMHDAGIGNERGVVGRFFMNHPKRRLGVIHKPSSALLQKRYLGSSSDGLFTYRGLRLREEKQTEWQVLNSYLRFEQPFFSWPSLNSFTKVLLAKGTNRSSANLQRLVSQLVSSIRGHAEVKEEDALMSSWFSRLSEIRKDPESPTSNLKRSGSLPYEEYSSPIQALTLCNFLEMAPSQDNRVLLSAQKDRHGQPIASIVHVLSELDLRSFTTLQTTLARELNQRRLGVLLLPMAAQKEEGPEEWEDASHHLGTTRMGTNPAHSVTDANCRVHSIGNLYVAGGSLFPTAGCANPTFTIVALAARLAEHLANRRA